jgi:chromosome segregation ATPase
LEGGADTGCSSSLVRLAEKYQERKNIILDKNKVFLGENLEKEISRKDILQLEKRLVDLELAVTELKESIKSIDVSMVPELNQKVEDVEDLIMVEQAGILELKKMMEESKPEKPAIPEDLEGRLKSIEDNIPNLMGKVEFESRLEEVQKELPKEEKPTPVEIEGLYDKVTGLETSLSTLKSQTDNISKELYEKVNEISLKATGFKKSPIDLDLLSSKIEAGKRSIDEFSKKKIELDLKVEEISKKMEILENNMGESPGQEVIDGLKLNRREIVATNARIDSLERVARELMSDVQNFEKSIRNFESIEKISLLKKNIEEKLERSNSIEEEIKKLASKVEMIYDEIDKRLEKLRGLDKDYSENISNLVESTEENKKEIIKIKKGETANFEKIIQESRNTIEEKFGEIEKKMHQINKHQIGELKNTIETINSTLNNLNEKILLLENRQENISHKITEPEITPLIEKIDSLTNEYKHFAGDVSKRIISIENIKPLLEKRVDELTKTLQPMIKKEIEPFSKRNESLENNIKEIRLDIGRKITEPEINKEIENMRKKQSEYLAETDKEIYDYINNQLENANKKIASVDINPLIGRINSLTEEYKNFAGDVSKKIISIENIKPMVEKRIEELTKTLQPMIKKEIEPMEKKVRETKLDEVNKILTDVITKIAVIENKIGLMEKGYGKKAAEVPKMQEKVIIRESRFLEEQFKEVVNRMIFLESRLIAIEGMMQEKSRALPIIIE